MTLTSIPTITKLWLANRQAQGEAAKVSMLRKLIRIQRMKRLARTFTFRSDEFRGQSQPQWDVTENHWESGTNNKEFWGTEETDGR